jgi:GH24 family phage-related lysozyme (muramidase)
LARAVSEAGLAFIKAHEGFRARATRLPNGRWLLGYSSVEDDADDRVISEPEAETQLERDLAAVGDVIEEQIFAPLTQHQLDALVSLGFSIGAEAFRACGMAEALNEGRPLEAARIFDRWVSASAGGAARPLDALVRRRTAEKAMFLTPDDGPVAAASALLRLARDADRARRGPDPELIARINSILPPMGAGLTLEDDDVQSHLEAGLPSAPYPVRRGGFAGAAGDAGGAGSSPRSPGLSAGGSSRRPGSAWDSGERSTVHGASRAAHGSPAHAVEQWPWLLGGCGLALAAVALGNVRAEAGEAGWTTALVGGALALGAGGYYAVRRLVGLEVK